MICGRWTKMQIFRLNNTYSIICRFVSTRSGFKHEATLTRNGEQIDSTKVTYVNRTWERYEYQTVLQKMINNTSELTDKEKRRFMNKV